MSADADGVPGPFALFEGGDPPAEWLALFNAALERALARDARAGRVHPGSRPPMAVCVTCGLSLAAHDDWLPVLGPHSFQIAPKGVSGVVDQG